MHERFVAIAAASCLTLPSASLATTLTGRVTDQVTGRGIYQVAVRVTASGYTTPTDSNGVYVIPDLWPGLARVEFIRIGYVSASREVRITLADPTRLDVSLEPRAIELKEVVISARPRSDREEVHEGQTPVLLTGRRLQERLGGTIAETMKGEAGLAERTMGNAPARPVLRGLGGQRVQVLSDGASTGDLSATSDDHAVVLDPLDAEAVEVIRGPLAFLYGSEVIGGVINVEESRIPKTPPRKLNGIAVVNGTSVDRGAAGTLRLTTPVGAAAGQLELTGRSGHDIRTPNGTLTNSDQQTWNGSLGLSVGGKWGYAGAFGSVFDSQYGIPGGFLGGHPNGVDIDLDRKQIGARLVAAPSSVHVKKVDVLGSWSRYFHEEIESNGACGISFGLVSYQAIARAHLDSGRRFGHGIVSLAGDFRDFANGCLSFLPPTTERTLSAAFYDEEELGKTRARISARWTVREVSPDREETNKAGMIRTRNFSGLSGGFSLAHPLDANLTGTLSVTRSFRAPAIEELFSDGPHLAAYSYEVGNADLDPERGLGLEAAVERVSGRLRGRAAAFLMDMNDYILATDTGELEYGPSEEGYLKRYQYTGEDARLAGGDVNANWNVSASVDLDATVSYVAGNLTQSHTPLPMIPPLSGRVGWRWHRGVWAIAGTVRAAARQQRTGEFESETAGYVTADLGAEWSVIKGSGWQTVRLRIENLTNAEYRNHLSRIKDVQPESGINAFLSYRVSW